MARRIINTLVSLTLVYLLSAVAIPIAAGDDVRALPQPLELPTTATVAATVPDIPDSAGLASSMSTRVVTPNVASVTSECSQPLAGPSSIHDEEHWIISVRHCQQSSHGTAHDCTFDYVRSDWNGRATQSTDAEFQAWLKPGVPVCIMVHGSFVTSDTVTDDSMNTFRWLRRAAPDLPLQVVFLTWPSEGLLTINPAMAASSAVPGLDVAILGRRAEFNGIRLVKLIQSISTKSPISLIGHSHGARIVASGLDLLGGGTLRGVKLCDGPSHRIRTVLAAAAIDHDWFCPGQRYDKALNATECLLNIRVRKDWALLIYPLRRPFSTLALGACGFTQRDFGRLNADASHVANYDLSELIGWGHIWPEFYAHPSLATELVPWVYFVDKANP